jgi:hypothetical protein
MVRTRGRKSLGKEYRGKQDGEKSDEKLERKGKIN